MAIIKSCTSALIVTAPRPLTSEQVDLVRAEIARQIPIGTTVIVVPTGFTVQPLSLAPSSVELKPEQADLAYQNVAILTELQKIGASMAEAIAGLGRAALRVES